MGIDYKGDGGPDGTVVGRNAADKLSFHGATPVSQIAYTASLVTTAPVSVCVCGGAIVFGFGTSAQAIALTTAVNAIQRALIDKGIMASS